MTLIVVWKDKNRFTQKKYGFITPPVIMNNITPDDGSYAVIESWNLVTQMLIICSAYAKKNMKVGIK